MNRYPLRRRITFEDLDLYRIQRRNEKVLAFLLSLTDMGIVFARDPQAIEEVVGESLRFLRVLQSSGEFPTFSKRIDDLCRQSKLDI